jgi:hypothetical protein
LGSKGRWEYLRAIYERYRKAGRKDKKAILSEFCANAGYHRKYAIRLLNGPRPEKRPRLPRRRGVSYDQETLAVLTAVWEAAGYPWSLRRKALLPWWMPWIRKRFGLQPEIAKQFTEDQSAANRSAAESGQDPEAAANLRAHQTRLSAHHRHSYDLDRIGGGGQWRSFASTRAEIIAARSACIRRVGQPAHSAFILLVGIRCCLAGHRAAPRARVASQRAHLPDIGKPSS